MGKFLHLCRLQSLIPNINALKAWLIKTLTITFVSILAIPNQATADFIITPLSGSSKHLYSSPYHGKFTALNGEYFDVSQYYQSKNVELNISGIALWAISPSAIVKLPWNFDNGYDSVLYKANPVLQIGVIIVLNSGKNTYEFGISNLFQLGGNVFETACVDDLYREFHCGTGLAWVDKPSPVENNHYTIQMSYKFVF